MTYRVRATPEAEADVERLHASLVERAGDEVARRWYESYTKAVDKLRTRPLACGLAYESPHFKDEIRHLLFWISTRRKYRALFTIRGDEVVILTVRAPGERPVSPREIAE